MLEGPVGECPIHMLFLYGSETHLNMAQYIISHFPHTITQIYNGAVSYPKTFFGFTFDLIKTKQKSSFLFLGILW